MKYGLIGTAYNSGIGHIAWGFAEQFSAKTLLVHNKPYAMFPERFENRRITPHPTAEDIDWLLEGIDVLITVETPYDWNVYARARRKGIKTVLITMIEWLNRSRPELQNIDLFVCASKYTADRLPTGSRIFKAATEVPIDTTKFMPKNVVRLSTFLHNAGHGGIGNRNSTPELLEAIQYVKKDVRFVIRSQRVIPNKPDDERVRYIEANVKDYWDLYHEGDCWIMPWKYGVFALGLQESMAAGLLPSITDMEPFNEYMPNDLVIKPATLGLKNVLGLQKELWATHDPKLIAQAIEHMADLSVEEVAELQTWRAQQVAAWSWKTWKPLYEKAFSDL